MCDRGCGSFLFGCGQRFEGDVSEGLHLVHDALAVEIDDKDVGEFLHEDCRHLHGSHHHLVVLCF